MFLKYSSYYSPGVNRIYLGFIFTVPSKSDIFTNNYKYNEKYANVHIIIYSDPTELSLKNILIPPHPNAI